MHHYGENDTSMQALSVREWVKSRNTPTSRLAYSLSQYLRHMSLPVVPGAHRVLYDVRLGVRSALAGLARVVWFTPLFQSRLQRPAKGLYVYGGMPLVLGPVRLEFGERVRICAQTTISGRGKSRPAPRLVVGNNVDIGWQTTIAVGRQIIIGDNVRIAGRAFLAGYPGHPLDAASRAAGAPDTDSQVGDIFLEDDVWLATGVTVSAGVTIGRGTIVAAGSVVTKSLPANVLAAGVPAKVVRSLEVAQDDHS